MLTMNILIVKTTYRHAQVVVLVSRSTTQFQDTAQPISQLVILLLNPTALSTDIPVMEILFNCE